MNQMDIQQASYFSIEVDFASLDAWPEERARAHIQNRSRQSQTIRVDKAAYMDMITDLHLHHGSLSRNRL